ncbi:hypothetical protein [Nostoc sphaeroides]|uniref:hypothetical protein n=2 Tax=Nostoc sphaeroides TaxID=446679 RepID=UPI000E48D197|nr:hypothetical protein [Nostoc sphaeroides]
MNATQGTTTLTAAGPITAYRLTHGYEPAYTKLYWSVANVVGVNQALLIQIIESWCLSNARLNKHGYFHDGEWWTSATYKEWENAYPALGSQRSIQRLLLGLEESSYVISCQLKKNKGNAAKFYRVDPIKVGALLLKDLSLVQKINNTNTAPISMMPKMDDVNDTHQPIVPKMDDVNDTHQPIVPKMDGIVPKMDGIVPKMDGVRAESHSQHTSQPSNKIKEIILPQSITGETEEKEKEGSKETDQEKALPDNHYAVKKEKISATNEKSTHEDLNSGAARENHSQILVFSDDPVKEVDFLLYYQTYQRKQGKDINNVAPYVTTVLSKKDEGSTEIFCLFEQWKAGCRKLERKINNFADDPVEVEKQRKKYDFPKWEARMHDHYYNMLLSEGLSKFCKHKVSAKWYEWASAKFPERFVDIPD